MSKFPFSAALAVSGAAFFAGSLVTLNMVSVAPNQAQNAGFATGQVTRAATPDLNNAPIPQPVPQAVVPQQVAAVPDDQVVDEGLSQTDAATLLAALTNSAQAPAANAQPQPQSQVSNLAIMQAAATTFRNSGGADNLDDAIKRNAVSDLDRGRQTGEIHELLSNAARNGLIQVPAGLTSADGSVDTRTLLFDIVNRAAQAAPSGTAPAQRQVAKVAPPTAVAPQTATQAPVAAQVYTVKSGDSLAFIALQFYGSTGEFRRIYNANRDVLTNPDRISVGQRLRIPAG